MERYFLSILTNLKNIDGVATNPDTVVGKYKKPSGSVSDASVSQDTDRGTGHYYFDIDVDQSGTWYYRLAGTLGIIAAAEGRFEVRKSQF